LTQRVLVPLRPGEALWVAISLLPNISLAATAVNGSEVRVVILTAARCETILVADALVVTDKARPIDETQIALATTRAAIAQDHLTFRLTTKAGHMAGQLGVVFGTPALYESISGLSAPQATSADDAYGGWRLP
jgi:hypothetical protein